MNVRPAPTGLCPKPRVARHELPWENVGSKSKPQRGCGQGHASAKLKRHARNRATALSISSARLTFTLANRFRFGILRACHNPFPPFTYISSSAPKTAAVRSCAINPHATRSFPISAAFPNNPIARPSPILLSGVEDHVHRLGRDDHPMIGASFNQYQVTTRIGAGGMGEVFRARDTRLNRFSAGSRMNDLGSLCFLLFTLFTVSAWNTPSLSSVVAAKLQNACSDSSIDAEGVTKKTRILGFRTLSTAVGWLLVTSGLGLQDGMAGSVDTNFNPGTICTPDIRCIIIDSNGNAVIGGPFREIGESERTGLARLLTDGTLDATCNPVVGNGINWPLVYCGELLISGKILIGGQFTTVNGVGRRCIAGINEDGSLDNDFNPGQGPDRAVQSMAVQSDGRALIGGSFVSSYGGRQGLVRLNADGTLDERLSPLLKVVGEFLAWRS